MYATRKKRKLGRYILYNNVHVLSIRTGVIRLTLYMTGVKAKVYVLDGFQDEHA